MVICVSSGRSTTSNCGGMFTLVLTLMRVQSPKSNVQCLFHDRCSFLRCGSLVECRRRFATGHWTLDIGHSTLDLISANKAHSHATENLCVTHVPASHQAAGSFADPDGLQTPH